MRFCFLSQSEYSNVRISRATIFRKTKENKYYHIKIAWSKIANWIKVIEKSLELNLTTSHYHNRLLWFFFLAFGYKAHYLNLQVVEYIR